MKKILESMCKPMCRLCKPMCKLLSLVDKVDKRVLFVIALAIFFLVGGIFGYSMGTSQQADKIADMGITIEKQQTTRVMGVKIAPQHYVNPFEILDDAKNIQFPIAQLKGCRNWNECRTFCSHPENFQSCVAWSKTQ